MRCALVDANANLINDVIVADVSDPAPDGFMLAMVPEFVNPGDAWNGGVFPEPPPEPSPQMAATSAAPVVDGMEML
jgi:hypothetical protein